MKYKKFLSLTSVAIIITLIASLSQARIFDDVLKSSPLPKETTEMLALFSEAYAKTKKEYVSEVTDKQLIEAAINGMLSALDPHSGYMDPKAFDDMKQVTKGEFGGIGIEVTMEHGVVKVVSPIEGTPADRLGMQPGDYIVGINGEPVYGLSLTEAVDKMRGRPGTDLKITVTRDGLADPLELTVRREVIKIKVTRAEAFDDVAYIKINSFSEKTSDSVVKEFDKLAKSVKKPLKGLVVDVRNNPGGLLEQAIAVTNLFVRKGGVVSTKGRSKDSQLKFDASGEDITSGLPIVVLVNNGSASASEILAGALQDHKRAIVVGTKTFGKGSVQSVIPMSNGGAIKITTSRYYTPNGRSIQADGIVPDIVVEQAKIEKIKSTKLNISEATLHKHLKSENKKYEAIKDNENLTTSKDLKELYERDFQLARGVDLIKAFDIMSKVQTNK